MGRPLSYKGSTLVWNKRGTLTSYGATSFTYNSDGIRISKGSTSFVVDGTRILNQVTGANSLKPIYLVDNMVGFWYNSTRYLFSKNIQGDVVSLHHDDGTLIATYVYDAYGNHKVYGSNGQENTEASFIGNINPFRYRGYYYDVETKLYYLNSRYYDPEVGRFISPDILSILDKTMMEANGLNLYMYCGNNPVMRVDPNGEAWWNWIIGGVLTAIGAILCFVPGAQTFGVALLVAGVSTLLSAGLESAGVDPILSMQIQSGLNIVVGAVLLFTPFAGIGASMIGSGVGSLVGGEITKAAGWGYASGWIIGSILGSIIGGKVYDTYKTLQIFNRGSAVIGQGMDRVIDKANQIGGATYGGMPGYKTLEKIAPQLTQKLGLAHNATWIDRVIKSGVFVVDIGTESGIITSQNYLMELLRLAKYLRYLFG